jgi:hypothetical protein
MHRGVQARSSPSRGEILLLKERLNPSRIEQKEVRTIEVARTWLQVVWTVPNTESRCSRLELEDPQPKNSGNDHQAIA